MNDLNKLAEWFNNLEYEKQLNIYNHINEYDELDELSPEDKVLLEKLVNYINEIACKQLKDEQFDITQILINAGFEKFFAYTFNKFSKSFVDVYSDSVAINELSSEQLDVIVKFIIENVIIYKHYEEMSFEYFVETGGFRDSDNAKRTLRFINNMINKVCNRELSPDQLRNRLSEEYKLSDPLSDIIIANIKQNLIDLEKAHFLEKLNMILMKLSNLSCSVG